MDERLKKALDFSNYQKTLELKKETLKLKCNQALTVNYENNIFKITKELINFVFAFVEDEYIIIENSSDVPVKVSPKKFYEFISETYKSAYKSYFEEYEKLKKARNITKVIS